MLLATFNINGIKARIEALLAWLAAFSPDVVCLQEIKSVDEGFPRAEIEALGYRVETHGQKGFNGVAILSKLPLDDVGGHVWCGKDDCRHVFATLPGGIVPAAGYGSTDGSVTITKRSAAPHRGVTGRDSPRDVAAPTLRPSRAARGWTGRQTFRRFP